MSILNFEKRAKMVQETIKLTTTQAIVKWLSNQFINIDGEEYHLCGGGFGIFGHGNVTGPGSATDK